MLNSNHVKKIAFLDTNVIVHLLRGQNELGMLFAASVTQQIDYAINQMVLLELLFVVDEEQKEMLNQLLEQVTMLSDELEEAERLVEQVRTIQNYTVHTNDLMILASAKQCDYLLTYDYDFTHDLTCDDHKIRNLVEESGIRIFTPEKFLEEVTMDCLVYA